MLTHYRVSSFPDRSFDFMGVLRRHSGHDRKIRDQIRLRQTYCRNERPLMSMTRYLKEVGLTSMCTSK